VGDSNFIAPTLTPPSNPAATAPYSAQVRNTATSDNWYSQSIDPGALTAGANYVASAYIWNFAPNGSTAGTYIKVIDAVDGLNNISAGLGAPTAKDNGSSANGYLCYFLLNQAQIAAWGHPVELRATAERGNNAGVLPAVWAQFDNIALTPAENFVGHKWNVNATGNWTDAGNWAGSQVPNEAGTVASFTDAINTAHTVHVNSNVTVGQINFNNSSAYTLDSTGGTIKLATPEDGLHRVQGDPNISVVAGNHTITAPVVFDNSSHSQAAAGSYRGILNVASGASLTLTNMTATSVKLTKSGGGTATVNKVDASSLNVAAGKLAVAANGTSSGTMVVNELTVAAGAALDLNDNDLIVNNGDFATLQGLISAGYRTSVDTAATGIISTHSQNRGGTTRLALFNNALFGVPEWPPGSGRAVAASAVIGKYTYLGDTDWDGQVTPNDFTAVDANIGMTNVDPGSAWFYGDTNFDGNISPLDYNKLAANLGLGASNPLASVPEPGMFGALFAAGFLFARRRQPAA
jgi:hypothetical protein